MNLRRPLIFVLALCAVLVLGMTARTGQADGAASAARIKFPLLGDFFFYCDEAGIVGNRLTVCLGLTSNVDSYFPQYAKSGATVRITLYLPTGVRILKSRIKMGVPPGVPLTFKYPASDFRYRMLRTSDGHLRPVWVFQHNTQGEVPNWTVTVNVPPYANRVCLGAVAVGVNIPHVAVQRTHSCYTRKP